MLSKLPADQKVRWWFFHKTPDGVYDEIHLRRKYMDWLELKLGYKCETDWYRVTHDDFNNYGRSLKGSLVVYSTHCKITILILNGSHGNL